MWYEAPDENKLCPICKKRLPKHRGDWGYRIEGKDYCSRTCQKKADDVYKASKEYKAIQAQLAGEGTHNNETPQKVTEQELSSWIRMLRSGCTVTAIAKAHGRNFSHVHHRLSRMGLLSPGRSKLTYQQADEIRQRIKNGATIQTLATEMGVSVATIHRIARTDWQNGRERLD